MITLAALRVAEAYASRPRVASMTLSRTIQRVHIMKLTGSVYLLSTFNLAQALTHLVSESYFDYSFTPWSLNASVGDFIEFQFSSLSDISNHSYPHSNSHCVAQGPFNGSMCSPGVDLPSDPEGNQNTTELAFSAGFLERLG